MVELILSDEFLERFWKKVNIKNKDECWEWLAYKDIDGYGYIQVDHKPFGAHRVMWIINNKKKIPKNMFICHHCDNPSCVNPNHLFLGSALDNTIDRQNKGRPVGTKKGTKFTQEHKEKLSKAKKGKKLSKEHIENLKIVRKKRINEKAPYKKLSFLLARKIRSEYHSAKDNREILNILANKYSVHKDTIRRVIKNQFWVE